MTHRRAREASLLLRAAWREKSDYWSMDRLVFCDESASNEKTGWRKRGWSPRGLNCSDLMSTKRTKRWSVLPALTINGYLEGTLIYQGSVKESLFLYWLQYTVLPQLTPGYHILVMDNASIHTSTKVRQLCQTFGVQLEYLPPYSPDFNPIEQSFNVLKAWI